MKSRHFDVKKAINPIKSEIRKRFYIQNVLKISIKEKFIGERGRINCSLRDKSGFWRWLGIQFVISEK